MDFKAMKEKRFYWYLPGLNVPRQVRVTKLSRTNELVHILGENWHTFHPSQWAGEEDEAFELHRAKLSRAQDIA